MIVEGLIILLACLFLVFIFILFFTNLIIVNNYEEKHDGENERKDDDENEGKDDGENEGRDDGEKDREGNNDEDTITVEDNNNFIYMKYGDPEIKNKMAIFDIDGTLMIPKNGFKENTRRGYVTWQYTFENVPEKLKELNDNGYTIAIITNQTVLSFDKYGYKDEDEDGCNNQCNKRADKQEKTQDFIERMSDFMTEVDVPMFLLGGKQKEWKKPCCKILDYFFTDILKINKDKTEYFYCGDFAGRKTGNTTNIPGEIQNDKNYSDYLFQQQCFSNKKKNKFFTPEELFEDESCEDVNCKPTLPDDEVWEKEYCKWNKCKQNRICN